MSVYLPKPHLRSRGLVLAEKPTSCTGDGYLRIRFTLGWRRRPTIHREIVLAVSNATNMGRLQTTQATTELLQLLFGPPTGAIRCGSVCPILAVARLGFLDGIN